MTNGHKIVGFTLLVTAALLAAGILPRLNRQQALAAQLHDSANDIPVVTVATARLGTATSSLSLPGSTQGVHEASLYARSNGYVKRWYADIGARVQAGDILADIETPELDQELGESKANLVQEEAQFELSKVTLARWKDLVQQDAATKQELDEKQAAFNAAQASVAAGKANVDRLTALQAFATVRAPFTGVVTTRDVDIGSLVTAGSDGTARPMFVLMQSDTLRIMVNVPQSLVASIHVGQEALVRMSDLGGAAFEGHITRTANALDPGTRTLPTEVRVVNHGGTLLPGMYAQVALVLTRTDAPLVIPANTLMIHAGGPEVATVVGGTVHIQKVSLGRDYGTEIEITQGLALNAVLVVNPGDDVTEGARVTVAPTKH